MLDETTSENETSAEELGAAIRCYQAETNQIAKLLMQHKYPGFKLNLNLLEHVLGTTNSYLESILDDIGH